MTIILKNIGRLWQLDPEGFLVNEAHSEKIVPPFDRVVTVVRETYLKYARENIHSIYLRGSIPRGLAIEGISDVDIIEWIKIAITIILGIIIIKALLPVLFSK